MKSEKFVTTGALVLGAWSGAITSISHPVYDDVFSDGGGFPLALPGLIFAILGGIYLVYMATDRRSQLVKKNFLPNFIFWIFVSMLASSISIFLGIVTLGSAGLVSGFLGAFILAMSARHFFTDHVGWSVSKDILKISVLGGILGLSTFSVIIPGFEIFLFVFTIWQAGVLWALSRMVYRYNFKDLKETNYQTPGV